MAILENSLVIGLTGPFGSGCSTAADLLKDRLGFHSWRMSNVIRAQWETDNPGKKPTRKDLQDLGNRIRTDSANPGELARKAIESLEQQPAGVGKIVIDGIRNRGEIVEFQNHFRSNFYLIALWCPDAHRMKRLSVYSDSDEGIEEFRADNERDKDQGDPFGQQVELCVDKADAMLTNSNNETLTDLHQSLVDTVHVVSGEKPRFAKDHEILMNLAYSASHGSKCLRRQVGAVIVDAEPLTMGEIVGQGFNENPTPTAPCVMEREYGADEENGILGSCYRDIVRYESYVDLARQKARCPECGSVIKEPEAKEPPWRCGDCGTNFEQYFWPERAMSWCTAIHAEVAAIMAAGPRARGATLYTTTFPCFQCAEKIAHAGIRHVVFSEPYPDVAAAARLELAGIDVHRFEGIRSGRFDEIFSRARPYMLRQREVFERRVT